VGGSNNRHNVKFNNMSSLKDIIRIIKSGRVKLVGDVTSMEEKRNAYEVWYENL
jgi:hypothetical protein